MQIVLLGLTDIGTVCTRFDFRGYFLILSSTRPRSFWIRELGYALETIFFFLGRTRTQPIPSHHYNARMPSVILSAFCGGSGMSQAPASPCDLQATPVRPEMASAAMVISLSSTDGNVAKPVCVRHVVAASHCGKGDPWELVRIVLAKRLEAVDLVQMMSPRGVGDPRWQRAV
jgi:hypothetical protein